MLCQLDFLNPYPHMTFSTMTSQIVYSNVKSNDLLLYTALFFLV